MKYKIATFLLLGITIILCFGYLNQKQEISKLNAQSKVIGKTDTIYINKPYKPVKEYGTQVLPDKVSLYKQKTNTPVNNSLDSVTAIQGDSIIQMLLSKDNMSLSFRSPIGGYLSKEFNLDLDKYQYNWVNGNLTQKKLGFKLKVEPYAYVKYRYFNRMADAGIGISFKTRNLQYKLGLNGFYYQCLQNKLGTDLEFSITYNLSK